MKKYLLFVFVLCIHSVYAQNSVSGFIIDNKNNPIEEVKVRIKNTKIQTYSDAEGKYTIQIPDGFNTLEYSKNGYKMQTFEITNDENVLPVISLNDLDLLEIGLDELLKIQISTAGKQNQSITEVPASVIVILRDDIQRFGYKSVEEILQDIPGMYLIDDYCWNGSKNYGIRGFFSTGAFNNMIVLINGIDQKIEVQYDANMTERISVPIEAIDRIEVIRGPMSVIYGSGAFFGAINIITNSDFQSKKSNIISASAGNLKSKNIYGQFKGKGDKFSYSFHASYYSDDGINVPFSDLMNNYAIATLPVDSGGWNLKTNSTKHLLRTERGTINFTGTMDDISVSFRLVNSQKGTVEAMFGAGEEGDKLYYISGNGSVNYKKQLVKSFGIKAKLDMDQQIHWVDNDFYFANNSTNNISRNYAYEGEISGVYEPNSNLNILAGINTRYVKDCYVFIDYPWFGYDNMDWKTKNVESFSVFAQGTYFFNKRFQIVTGFRLERKFPYTIISSKPKGDSIASPPLQLYHYQPSQFFDFIPRLALLYSITENSAIKFLYGKAIMQPSISTISDLVGTNLTLKPAEIQTFEINYNGNLTSQLSINTSVFYNTLNNLITRINVLEDSVIVIISSNSGKMTTKGAELSIRYTPLEKLIFDFSAVYQISKDARRGFEDIDLAYSPNLLLYGKIAYAIKNIDICISGRYVDAMQSAWSSANIDNDNLPIINSTAPYQGRIAESVPSYFSLGSNVRISNILKTGLYANASCTNILNQKIYYPSTTSNPQLDKGTLGFGRWFYCTIGIIF